jgi:response regulator RpfG family c-di-GMP phosphodiesterase
VYFPEIEGVHVTEGRGTAHGKEASHGSETLLLVEDEEAVRKFFRYTLSKGGYTVLKASNGPETPAISDSYPDPIRLLFLMRLCPV